MGILFSYRSGRRVSGAVLAVGVDFVRVVAPGHTDGFDLFLRDEGWVTETGRAIFVEAILFSNEAYRDNTVAVARAGGS
jgi:hypothetical protein